MAYCPPSDFRVNVEAGLRTALSAGLAFLWLGLGPHSNRLSFFAGVSSIVCVGNSAGQTIARSLVSGLASCSCCSCCYFCLVVAVAAVAAVVAAVVATLVVAVAFDVAPLLYQL